MTGKSMDRTDGETARRLSDLAYDRILECLFDRRVSAGAFVSQGELSDLVVADRELELEVFERDRLVFSRIPGSLSGSHRRNDPSSQSLDGRVGPCAFA